MGWLWELISILFKLLLDILLLLSPVIIIFIIVCVVKGKKTAKEEAAKKQKKAEEDKRRQEFEKKAKKVYAENFSRLYDNRSTAELKKIYDLLQIMHHNTWDFNDWSTVGPATASAFSNAQDELLRVMGKPTWKRLLLNGRIEYSSTPTYVTSDMNYVYNVLRSRGITNW